MHERTSGSRAGRRSITVAASVIAVLLVVVSSLLIGASGAMRGSSPPTELEPAVIPAALADTAIDLNRSQSSGTYVAEYVVLNNSTTLTALPAALTVAASTCKWVTVENLTEAAKPSSSFHNVEYANATVANGSGTVVTHSDSFKVCGGSGMWINFVYWTFSIYEFSSTGLGVSSTVTLGGFSDWTGTTVAPANLSATIGPSAVAQFIVASNETFTATFPALVNGPTSCDFSGQLCSYTQYSYVSAADALNVTKSHTVAFTKASGLLVAAAYENWTVGYSSATVSTNTGVGGFFAGTDSVFQEVFVQFWYLWIVGLLVVALIVGMARNRKGRGRK
jgi:hypothetical protein